jgi:hypothetical protein
MEAAKAKNWAVEPKGKKFTAEIYRFLPSHKELYKEASIRFEATNASLVGLEICVRQRQQDVKTRIRWYEYKV